MPGTWEWQRARAGDRLKSWPYKGLCLFVGQTSSQLARVGPPWLGRQGLHLGTWLRPRDVLGRPRLERVLVLSALMKALEDFGPRCQAAAGWTAQAAGLAAASPARRVSLPLPSWNGKAPYAARVPPFSLHPSPSLVRLQLSWDPKSVFCPASAGFTSWDTGELRACKSGQEA